MKKFIIIGIYITLTGCNTISNQAHLFVTGYYIISQLLYYTLYQGNTDISAYLGEEIKPVTVKSTLVQFSGKINRRSKAVQEIFVHTK